MNNNGLNNKDHNIEHLQSVIDPNYIYFSKVLSSYTFLNTKLRYDVKNNLANCKGEQKGVQISY